jgi:preprotein translocase subunit SecD
MNEKEDIPITSDRRIQIVIGLVLLSVLLAYFMGIKFGIEFEGGTRIPITLEKSVNQQTMADMVNIIKTRVSKFGLTQVVVRGVGETQIYVEVPKSDSSLVTDIEKLVKREGKYEGIVDGRLAVDGREIIPGSIRQEGVTSTGSRVSWSVGFAISPEAAKKFSDAAYGKAGYPVYMFLDRPENSFVIISRDRLLGNTSLAESDALDMLGAASVKDSDAIQIFVLENWDDQKKAIGQYNFTNETKAIIAEDTPASVVSELRAMNITIVTKTADEMIPVYSLNGEKRFVEKWTAIGLLSAPVLSEGVTKGSAGQLYTINGPAAGSTTQEQLVNADKEMRDLKSILSGGALPVRVILGSSTTIPAPLGAEFLRYSIIGLACALLAVVLLVAIRYRHPKLIIPILLISLAELTIIVCIMGSVGTIDLSAMAGIISAIGTSVDAQIIVTDELTKRDTQDSTRRKLEKAFGIITTNATIAIVAMVPLLFSGLIETIGFATTLTMGYMLGVFITRPAYGVIAGKLIASDDAKASEKKK